MTIEELLDKSRQCHEEAVRALNARHPDVQWIRGLITGLEAARGIITGPESACSDRKALLRIEHVLTPYTWKDLAQTV